MPFTCWRCGACPQVGLPLRLRTFPSGFTVIQSAAHSDDAVCAAIARMVEPHAPASHPGPSQAVVTTAVGQKVVVLPAPEAAQSLEDELGPGITAPDVASKLSIAPTIAAEHLATAEARGVVCRDDGPEGLRFFRNFFLTSRCH